MKIVFGLMVAAMLMAGVWLSGTPDVVSASTSTVESAIQERGREIVVPGGRLFSRVIRAGDFLFLSGALGRSRDGENGAGPETQRALESLKGLLEQADSGVDDLVKCTIFLAEIADYGAMNEAYSAFFGEIAPPARTALAAKELVNGAAVEVECMAYAPVG